MEQGPLRTQLRQLMDWGQFPEEEKDLNLKMEGRVFCVLVGVC